MEGLKDRVVLITGAAGGLGQVTVAAFLEAGAKVALTDVNMESLKKTQENLSDYQSKFICFEHDVTSPESWDSVIDHVVSTLGPINVLVNNAAISHGQNVEDTTYESWKLHMAVNLDGTYLGTQRAIAHMKQHGGGSIVNISSMGTKAPGPNAFPYCASKAGVELLTKAAAHHVAQCGYGIRINVVQPGPIRTPMLQTMLEDPQFAESMNQMIDRVPLGRLAEPLDIAKAIMFLASDASSYMTGAEVIVDGGYTTG